MPSVVSSDRSRTAVSRFAPFWCVYGGTLALAVVILALTLALTHWAYQRALDGMNAAMAASDVRIDDA